jgi:hypothetical protein
VAVGVCDFGGVVLRSGSQRKEPSPLFNILLSIDIDLFHYF